METIKAIDTPYKGYRFRSRLEARWAVFLDTINLDWEYESEGYTIQYEGQFICYLPDFYIPALDAFLEVKGPPLNEQDRIKAEALAASTGKAVIIAQKIPPQDIIVPHFKVVIPNTYSQYFEDETESVWWDHCVLYYCYGCGRTVHLLFETACDHIASCDCDKHIDYQAFFQVGDRVVEDGWAEGVLTLEHALDTARGARFEFLNN